MAVDAASVVDAAMLKGHENLSKNSSFMYWTTVFQIVGQISCFTDAQICSHIARRSHHTIVLFLLLYTLPLLPSLHAHRTIVLLEFRWAF